MERFRVPDDVAWVDGADFGMAEQLFITVVPDGRSILLEGSGRLIWLTACGGGDVFQQTAELVGLPRKEIEDEVKGFVSQLLERGLLTSATRP